MIEVTASYTRTINHQLHGGEAYENSKHFCSLKQELPEGSTQEQITETYKKLQKECKELVGDSVVSTIDSIKASVEHGKQKKTLNDI